MDSEKKRTELDPHNNNTSNLSIHNASTGETPEIPKDETIPLISPLMKYSPFDQNTILLQIFKEAKFNVDTYIKGTLNLCDDEYNEAIYKESDRLLKIWMKLH